MKLGELIHARREQADMSLQDLADATGLSKPHVWEIERGKVVNIGLLSAVRISIALGIPVNVMAAAALEQTQESDNG